MSWTIYQQPNSAQSRITPAYNNIIISGISSLYAAGYTYKLTLTLRRGGTLVDTIVLNKSALSDGSVFFEVQRLLEDYIEHDWSNTVEDFSLNPNSYLDVYWSLQLLNASAAVVETLSVTYTHDPEQDPEDGNTIVTAGTGATAYTFTIYNSVFEKRDFLSYSSQLYTITDDNAYTNKFQKEITAPTIFLDQHDALYVHSDLDSDIAAVMRLTTYDSAGSVLKNVTIANPYDQMPNIYNSNYRFFKIPSGTQNLALINNGLITGDTQPLIGATTASYTIALEDSTSVVKSTITYTIAENCSRYENYRLHWLNKLGGFEAFNFTLVSRKQVDIERSTNKQSLNRMIGTSWTYAGNSRVTNSLYTRYKYKTVINSNWLTETESQVLLGLLTSPVVYLERAYNDFIAVDLTDGNYEIKQVVVDGLFQLVLTIYDNFEEVRQRG